MRNKNRIIITLLLLVSAVSPLLAQRGGDLPGGSVPVSTKAWLTVTSNVPNARVEVFEQYQKTALASGMAPFRVQLNKGSYRAAVIAPGYKTQERNINLNSDLTVTINLEADTVGFSVTSNVAGATVEITGRGNNTRVRGTVPFTAMLQPGNYDVKVFSSGYYEDQRTIYLDRTQALNINLQPMQARLTIVVPNNIADYSKPNWDNHIEVYDNGSKVRGTELTLVPGQHTIRVVSGGLAAQQTLYVSAGEVYTLTLDFGFGITKR